MLKLELCAGHVPLAACTHDHNGQCAKHHDGNNMAAYDHPKCDK